ncbi:hypothetical protein INR49_008083 [Caranx melampygus]|nr:hypothetical protein INR49_008083 [Caranx melampygus]
MTPHTTAPRSRNTFKSGHRQSTPGDLVQGESSEPNCSPVDRDHRVLQQEFEARSSPPIMQRQQSRRNLGFEPLSTTALILEDRPPQVGRGDPETRQQYEQMVAEAQRRELKESQRSSAADEGEGPKEEEISNDRWSGTSSSCRTGTPFVKKTEEEEPEGAGPEEEGPEEEEEEDEGALQSEAELSSEQREELRAQKIRQKKLLIAALGSAIIFKDIAPTYRIRPLTPAEKAVKSYGGLAQVAVRCLCELLLALPHFNFHNNIVVVLVPLMNDPSRQVSDMCCDAFKKLFQQDREGGASLAVVRVISGLIKSLNYNVRPEVLRTLLSLRIKEVEVKKDIEATAPKKKFMNNKEKKKNLSRMQRKWKKAEEKLEKELLEAEASESKEKKIKLHTETLNIVFLIYFRILKKAQKSVLLPAVLEGLANFAHLINLEFFDDLLNVLQNLIRSRVSIHFDSAH